MSSLKPLIINTRPVERATLLTKHLQAAGFVTIDIPMLALHLRPILQPDIDIMHQWIANEYRALVVISPTAAALGLSVWQTLSKDKQRMDIESLKVNSLACPIIAIGDATFTVLQEANCKVLRPKLASNESMLAMPEIAQLQAGEKVLIWRGLGGRRLLVDNLQKRGIQVDSIAWYERTMPKLARRQYEQWLTNDLQSKRSVMDNALGNLVKRSTTPAKPIVIISSGTAFEYWMNIVNQSKYSDKVTLKGFDYVVLGVRLAKIIAQYRLDHWQVKDLSPETILTTINLPKARCYQ